MSNKGTNENSDTETTGPEELKRERYELLHRLEDWLETPMLILAFVWLLYAFGIFGYVTAALATFFVGRDADSSDAEVAGAKGLAAVRDEVSALRDEIRGLSRQTPQP